MTRDRYTPPHAPTGEELPPRGGVWPRRILLIVVAALILPLAYFLAREGWRAHALWAFCKAAQPGLSIPELLSLEKRHWIDESYLVDAHFDSYIDQAHSPSLEFRSHMYDPEFACVITHDGHTVKFVQLLTLEGVDAHTTESSNKSLERTRGS